MTESTSGYSARKEGPTNTVSFPLGPYHPALAQPFSLMVKLRGETMEMVDPPQAGYCARGIERLVQGQVLTQVLAVVERSCGLAGHTHRTAVCQAVEQALRVTPSRHASLLRAAFAEIERMLARLWTLGMSARAASLDSLWRAALDQRETLFAALYQATGERCFWGVGVPGGVRVFDPPLDFDALFAALARLEPDLAAWCVATRAGSPLGRAAAGVGFLDAPRARALGVRGIAGHASGVTGDLRRDAPDVAYTDVAKAWPDIVAAPIAGDAATRLAVAADDLVTSARLAHGLLGAARDANDTSVVLDVAEVMARRGDAAGSVEGAAMCEGPHGAVSATLALADDGSVDHVRLRPPVAGVWAALPEVLGGQPVARAPLIVASLDLCVECLDL